MSKKKNSAHRHQNKQASVSIMRILRRDWDISLYELAEAAGVTHQYMSGIELGIRTGDNCSAVARRAFDTVIEQRSAKLRTLQEVYVCYRDRLLEFTTEMDGNSDEL